VKRCRPVLTVLLDTRYNKFVLSLRRGLTKDVSEDGLSKEVVSSDLNRTGQRK
jgi:hypothetical protein